MSDDSGNSMRKTGLGNMIQEICKVPSFLNTHTNISGHLAYTKELHVCQVIEGKADEITYLMAKIREDARLNIYKEFKRKLQTVNKG